MTLQLGDDSSRLRGRHHRGTHQISRLDRRLLGGAVLAPQGLHPRLHHRARLHGQRPSPSSTPRNVKIIGLSVDAPGQPRGVGQGHRRDTGHRANYPIISDSDFNVSKLYGMLPAETSGERTPHAGRQPDRPQRVRDRPRQEGQADPHLPDDHRAQLRRGAARDRLAAAHRQAQGRHTRELEARREGDHLRAPSPTTRPKRPIRTAGRSRPYIRIVPQPS